MRFQDKVVLITGSASGIGLAAAQAFAAEGAKLVLADRQAETGEAVAERLRQAGHAVIFVPTDVSDYAAVQRLVAAAVSQFGRLDIAINNAGIGAPLAPTAEVALPDWDRVIAVNQTGVFYGLKEQLGVMARQGSGCVINIASIAGLRGLPLQLAYTASKHAVVGMTKAAAGEYARFGIRVNAVCPVFTHTPLVDQLFTAKEGIDEKFLRTIPLRRFGEVADIVNAITWLADDATSYVTGLALPIDGGQTA
jgi:NAD(P)-dependent dehydrogenase (short-subunit alcohol dehydrogenase family)